MRHHRKSGEGQGNPFPIGTRRKEHSPAHAWDLPPGRYDHNLALLMTGRVAVWERDSPTTVHATVSTESCVNKY